MDEFACVVRAVGELYSRVLLFQFGVENSRYSKVIITVIRIEFLMVLLEIFEWKLHIS
jgi:hypothetical protein